MAAPAEIAFATELTPFIEMAPWPQTAGDDDTGHKGLMPGVSSGHFKNVNVNVNYVLCIQLYIL